MFVNQSRKCPLFNLIFWKEKWNYYLFSGQNSKPAKSKIQLLLEWMECSFTSIYTWGSVNLSVKTLFKKHFFCVFQKLQIWKFLPLLELSLSSSYFCRWLTLLRFKEQRNEDKGLFPLNPIDFWRLERGERRREGAKMIEFVQQRRKYTYWLWVDKDFLS